MDTYFQGRQRSERLKLALYVAMQIAGVVAILLSEYVYQFEQLKIAGLALFLLAALGLASWVLDGKEYAFPKKSTQPKSSN
ncbi:hypothetical protein K0504_09640 [Neiella marina]|uniref:Uncharacterized protein n=1 Tax=Neiella holothuriorum TaxID=2870530 RepID=A0ABS7EG36_9GAMM|nr:hypothetical protein [Neiella holothuriorum]MBW8191298.1 hypothetical protein [Neiella holothuriorum]